MRQTTVSLLLSALALASCSNGSSTPSATGTPSSSATGAGSTATPTPLASSPEASPTAAAHPRLTGDGIDLPTGVLLFGAPFETAAPALRAGLGAPTKDTGVRSSFSGYGTCPGTKLRALEFGGGALAVLFGDVKGRGLTMYEWELADRGTPASVPKASAFIGDVTTYDFGVGTTVAALRSNLGPEQLTITPADEPVAASFKVMDQSSGFGGQLSGTTDGDKATFVFAGQPCGE